MPWESSEYECSALDPGNSGPSRLRFVDIQIILGMTRPQTLLNTFAHELGHTFGLDDCYNCGPKTVMDSGEAPPSSNWDKGAWNYTEDIETPTTCDLGVISSNIPDYAAGACNNAASVASAQPYCTDGTATGFASVGPSGEYTCDGAVCDGCNGSCDNFAPGNGDPGALTFVETPVWMG